ncbi:MAG: flagellar hook-associated protein FlgK [Woeseiaceae bacterium]
MPSLLSTSLTGMLAFQRALETTGHNIANANTPGYNRQVSEFSTRIGSGSGSGYIGGGTQIKTVKRIYDQLLGEQLQSSTTNHARFDMLNTLATRIDGLLSDPQTGLSSGMQSFFNSVQDLANDPSSVPIRQAVLGEADGIVQRFDALNTRLQEIDGEVNQRIRVSVDDINRLATEIADINGEIALAQGRVGQPPNDLLDQRDRLVMQMSEQISVATVLQDDGTMNVFMGSGQPLVTGESVSLLAVQGSEFDPSRLQITYEGSGGSTPLDSSLTGGVIGGLIDFRAEMLDPARQALGETALALALQFNEQHRSGMDLRGSMGADFFGIDPPTILASGNNLGTGTAAASVSDLGAITGADYVLNFDGAAYSLSRADTGQPVAMTGTGTPADPFVADGLSISVAGAPAAGDQLLIRPARDAAGSLSRILSDPQAVAMALPVRVSSAATNTGDGNIGNATVVDRNDPDLLTPALITFTNPTTYSINGAGAFAYTSGDPILVNGSSFEITGAPGTGDSFSLEPNFGAIGDNGNGLSLAGVQADQVLANGSVSINENYSQLIASVGSTTRQVQAGLDAQSVILANTQEAFDSKSGVNLDEEAANLVRYQQAYQAVAQVVAVTSTLFDTLLSATRR